MLRVLPCTSVSLWLGAARAEPSAGFYCAGRNCALFRHAERRRTMTSREAVRTAVIIGGLWLVFSALSVIPEIIVSLATDSKNLQGSNEALTGALRWMLVPILFGVVLFGVLPGIYVIKSSEAWTDRVVRTEQTAASIEPSLVLAVGVMVFGFSLGVNGAISMASSLAGLASVGLLVDDSSAIRPRYVQGAVHGLLSLVAGFLSFRWGSRGVLREA